MIFRGLLHIDIIDPEQAADSLQIPPARTAAVTLVPLRTIKAS